MIDTLTNTYQRAASRLSGIFKVLEANPDYNVTGVTFTLQAVNQDLMKGFAMGLNAHAAAVWTLLDESDVRMLRKCSLVPIPHFCLQLQPLTDKPLRRIWRIWWPPSHLQRNSRQLTTVRKVAVCSLCLAPRVLPLFNLCEK